MAKIIHLIGRKVNASQSDLSKISMPIGKDKDLFFNADFIYDIRKVKVYHSIGGGEIGERTVIRFSFGKGKTNAGINYCDTIVTESSIEEVIKLVNE